MSEGKRVMVAKLFHKHRTLIFLRYCIQHLPPYGVFATHNNLVICYIVDPHDSMPIVKHLQLRSQTATQKIKIV